MIKIMWAFGCAQQSVLTLKKRFKKCPLKGNFVISTFYNSLTLLHDLHFCNYKNGNQQSNQKMQRKDVMKQTIKGTNSANYSPPPKNSFA